MKELYLSVIRSKLMKEMDLYKRIEDLIVEYRRGLEEVMELCSESSDLEAFELVEKFSNTMSNIGEDLRELDEDSRKCVNRINTYRKILGLQPIKGAA